MIVLTHTRRSHHLRSPGRSIVVAWQGRGSEMGVGRGIEQDDVVWIPPGQNPGVATEVSKKTAKGVIFRPHSYATRTRMKVGVFTPLLSQLPLDGVLQKLKALHIHTVELSTENYPGNAHCNLSMLDNPSKLAEFKGKLEKYEMSISALSCHGNSIHPNENFAKQNLEISRKTILLAEKLKVPVVVDFSGCPGDSQQSKYPNWVTCPWPPDFLDILKWQWDEVVTPFWKEHAKFAADHGIKIAIEMHPGFVAYSPETMLRLRSIAGTNIGCNYDPSHMFWQNIDPIAAIRVLGDAIFHVHAKDTQIYSANLPKTGVLDTKPYTDERNRSWIFRTCGYGHGAEWWKEFVSTLRMFGYDYVLSIEHEDSLLSAEEGLTRATQFLNEIVIKERPAAAWWV
jgi:sugar phosphate isomerase/epimerase